MPYDPYDHRKVQTAVLGNRNSDHPVLLPFYPIPLDRFRRDHVGDTFWCGTLLGGCGKQVTTKRYTERVCHFAHHAPVKCDRVENGEASADHLFIKRAFDLWLVAQDIRRYAEFHGAVPNGLLGLSFDVPALRSVVSLQLARQSVSDWQARHEKFAQGGTRVEWVFGPETMLTKQYIDRHGRALRVACETRDHTRHVKIGVEDRKHRLEWFDLDGCRMTSAGIVVPGSGPEAVTEPRPVVAPEAEHAAPWSTALYMEVVGALRSQPRLKRMFQYSGVTWIDAEVRDSVGHTVRACVVVKGLLSHARRGDVYRLVGETRPRMTHGTTGQLEWAVEAAAAYRLTDAEAANSPFGAKRRYQVRVVSPEPAVVVPAQPPVVRGPVVHEDPKRRKRKRVVATDSLVIEKPGFAPVPDSAPGRVPAAAPVRAPVSPVRRRATAPLAATGSLFSSPNPLVVSGGSVRPDVPRRPAEAIRWELEVATGLVHIASDGETTTWSGLVLEHARSALFQDYAGEFGCLRSVDQPTGEGVPELMLSSLVVSPTGGPPGCARELLDAFGLCVPVTDTALEIIWRREQERVHAAYAVPPRVPPARLVPER
ncbi:competence protein CoiA family protein [Kitasatospora herbaricolor]|uniref:Competence protein CoiA n=1 Tax=Kitasatospora herbaricolor TaxID=68217 RepID=A0ABZ1WFW1_9ACTN|nr:competence protein CoiA family protein [Kitasatospora herbaricolor]